MPRVPIAFAYPDSLPPAPSTPHPSPSPLQTSIASTLGSSDYDLVAVPLTNGKWQDRWEHLCLRPMEEELDPESPEALARDQAREAVDREADEWRKDGALRREEMNVTRLEEARNMIAMASDWLELDSGDEGIRFDSELALRAEFAQALYLSMPTFVIPAPTLSNRAFLPSYARAIAGLLQMGGPAAFTQISIRIPISDPAELIQQGPASVASPAIGNGAGGVPPIGPPPPPPATAKHHKRMSSLSTRPQSMHQAQLSALASQNQSQSQNGQSMQGANGNLAPNGQRNVSGASAFSQASSVMSARSAVGTQAQGGDPNSTWEMWDTVRAMCGYHPRLSIMLDLTNPLPPSAGALARWTAEPVKHIWLPATSFISNAKGYPVLSKACQAFLKGLVKNNPTYILAQTTLSRHTAGGSTAYLQYIRHITSQAAALAASTAAGSEFAPGYADYLQAPLQPLMDDLGSATYDVFERDPVKYTQYEEAILLALHDLPAGEKHTIIVVGAGRGPLVACALRALKRANREAAVYAVEKNANAFITLQERKETEWHDSVEIVFGDMRTIDLPVQADIIVSELLGSFADNELSPECLDGAMRFLKPHGISIPMSYTAHLAPLSSAKLHADVIAAAKDPSAAETPYVVMMSQVNVLSAEPPAGSSRCGDRVQQCWIFEHPRSDLILDAAGNPMTNSHNTRSASLTFHIPHSAPCHGLAGYFEAHLYGNVGLSTQPETAHRISPDMTSWFPIFFPFRHPIYLPSGSELEVNMWRLSDNKGKKVWYEWSAESFLPVIHSGPGSASASARPLSASASAGLTASGSANGGAMNAGANGSLAPTPTGSLTAATRNSHHQLVPASSAMMDAAYSPTRMSFGAVQGLGGIPGQGGEGRIKIGQTGLHNAGGVHSWVGL